MRLLLLLLLLPLLPSPTTAQPGDIRQEILRLVNQERERAGAPPLLLSNPLARAAQEHAEEIARRGTVRLPAGADDAMQARLERAGYHAHAWSESITSTTAEAAELMRDWKERDHASFRRLMDPAFEDVGIGLTRMRGMPLYTVLFAVPQGAHFARETAELRDLERVRAEVLKQVNAVRRRAGLAALRPDPALDRAAQKHAEDMLARSYFEHRSPEGKSVRERSTAQGYQWRAIGENIAEGQVSVDEVMDTWMNSPGHCENILGTGFTELGVGLALGRSGPSGRYRVLWVQNFGRPR
jgi:uncharacterized protein YkwD